MAVSLQFGLARVVPEGVGTAWGARWIYPDDMLPDRQSVGGDEGKEWAQLQKWLDSGPIGKAREKAEYANTAGTMTHDSSETFILWKDSVGVVVGSPNRSYGYLYVAAWIHFGDPNKQAPAESIDLTKRYPRGRTR